MVKRRGLLRCTSTNLGFTSSGSSKVVGLKVLADLATPLQGLQNRSPDSDEVFEVGPAAKAYHAREKK